MDLQRYIRQIALPEIGQSGQRKLLSSRVLIVGAGGLGSSAGFYLAAAGVGTLGLMDGDKVELSNLQRQIAHVVDELGRTKVESAAKRFGALNNDVRFETHNWRLDADNARSILEGYDFVIDATDHPPSKLVIAEACHAAGKPYSHAGVKCFHGQTFTVLPGRSACWACLAGDMNGVDENPAVGPFGGVPGVIGVIQATEAVKYLLGLGQLLTDRVLFYDALLLQFRSIAIRRNPDCPLCRQ